MPSPSLILASRSPQRQKLLRDGGYEFETEPADINEADYPKEMMPADVALYLARSKATRIADKFPESAILAADTIVTFGDQMLGKPVDADEARKMLTLLAGTTHIVITGLAVARRRDGFWKEGRAMSAVRMKPLSRGEIDQYVASNDWQGKAGGYGIQDEREDPFVKRISGSYSNIVGLPMKLAGTLLEAAGIAPGGEGAATATTDHT